MQPCLCVEGRHPVYGEAAGVAFVAMARLARAFADCEFWLSVRQFSGGFPNGSADERVGVKIVHLSKFGPPALRKLPNKTRTDLSIFCASIATRPKLAAGMRRADPYASVAACACTRPMRQELYKEGK